MMGHGSRRKPMSTLSLVRQHQSNGQKRSVNIAVFDSRMETKRAKLVEDKVCEINPNNFTTIEALPPEVLTHILQFLSPIERLRSEQVCKKWRDASRQTWRDVQALYFIFPKSPIYHEFEDHAESYEFVEKEGNQLFIGVDSQKIMRCLVSRVGCFINKLIFNYWCSSYQQAMLSIISSYCRNVKVLLLNVHPVLVDKETLSKLFECNQALHSVIFQQSSYCIQALPLRDWRSLRFERHNECDKEKVVSLIEYSEGLEEFGCARYTTRIVEALLKLPNLKSLRYISHTKRPSFEMILHASLLNRLRNLELCNLSIDFDSNVVCNVLQHCCQLESLNIDCTSHVLPMILLKAILALPKLETLVLQFKFLSDDILLYLTKFRNLSLDDHEKLVTNNGIFQMIKKSEFLENLDIKSTGVTTEMFKQLVKEMSNRQKYLKVKVPTKIFDEVSQICAGSKIRVVKNMQCFSRWPHFS